MDSDKETTPVPSDSSSPIQMPPSKPPDSEGPVLHPTGHAPQNDLAPKKRRFLVPFITLIVVLIAVVGVGYAYYRNTAIKSPKQSATTASTAGMKAPVAQTASTNVWKTTVNPKALPLGDGHVSTTPKVGYVDSCMTTFNGRGALNAGPWINTSNNTWNSQAKLAVEGSVSWPNARYSATINGSNRGLTTNDLPESELTGIFPIASTDPAYQYDRNPNHIAAQSLTYTLPVNPTAVATPSCTGMGVIGVLNDGVVLYNGLDAAGRDAVAHEVQDVCNGHPDQSEEYHYHDIPSCIMNKATGPSTLVGYAIDGYGIYVERDKNGNLPTNADLDACHGRTSEVMWDGKLTNMYHYDATLEYPYTIGCFHGTPLNTHTKGGNQSGTPTGSPQGNTRQTGPPTAP